MNDNSSNARVRRHPAVTLAWVMPAVAIALALYVVWRQLPDAGPDIQVLVADAAGIQANQTPVQYRGVTVGMVEEVALHPQSGKVLLELSMSAQAESLLREDTQFWVVRPQIGLTGVRELGTLISGPYLALRPGAGAAATRFEALDRPPAPAGQEGALEIVLVTERLGSIREGTPLTYRGVEIGEVYAHALDAAAQNVLLYARVREPYVPLVRNNSVFWNNGGIDVDITIFGAEVSAESLAGLLRGSIAMAVPEQPDEPAGQHWHFQLHDSAEEEWLEWRPPIETGLTAPSQGPSQGQSQGL